VRPFIVRETTPVTPPTPRLLDRVRDALRARRYTRHTEDAYVAWIKRNIFSFFTPSAILPRWVARRSPAAPCTSLSDLSTV
jgi:hypothetical protein